MNNTDVNVTRYLRSGIAAQMNTQIDFKSAYFGRIKKEELISGFIGTEKAQKFFKETAKKPYVTQVNVIVCAKAIKIGFREREKTNNDIAELTGVFFIPAILNRDGKFSVELPMEKIPWFPREVLYKMVEPRLCIGTIECVDTFVSKNIDRKNRIENWNDYVKYFIDYYEYVTKTSFVKDYIISYDKSDYSFETEEYAFIFEDKTINSTFHILSLYNNILKDFPEVPLYKNFISQEFKNLEPLTKNSLASMALHCGQMNSQFPLSPSQRESLNHFNIMEDGDILAVCGPPGTGKTTLLQSIVANLYIKRALDKDIPPIIVASSTNNQAVTNIITSFGEIKKGLVSNLEERWICGVNSFATYFPSSSRIKEAESNNYQYTNQRGDNFVAGLEFSKNIENSEKRMLEECSKYFRDTFTNIKSCENILSGELTAIDNLRKELLFAVQSCVDLGISDDYESFIAGIDNKIIECEKENSWSIQRIDQWEERLKRKSFFKKLFNGSSAMKTDIELFMSVEEQGFLDKCISLEEIKEKYAEKCRKNREKIIQLKDKKVKLAEAIEKYQGIIKELSLYNIEVFDEDDGLLFDVEKVNQIADTRIRYIEFWLAVHYYECRWINDEDGFKLTEKQKGKRHENVIIKFFRRLCLVSPCLVMTFFLLPKQFSASDGVNNNYLYNFIDLLIVDEAGQVSPEIAAPSFALAKRALVVGDIHQIEPVWGINRSLDIALAMQEKAVKEPSEFESLENAGINCSNSSVMLVAQKSCKYKKNEERGLFLCEHRRCYDEIIEYCNLLVYHGNLEPKRGKGKADEKLAVKNLPQMGYYQIDCEYSSRKGGSRVNKKEAETIAQWLSDNFCKVKALYPKENAGNLVGVITPFKAQVSCIKRELKKQMPDEFDSISVGTVHTFQGAERKIIIMSTVYGNCDGCYFIDTNRSLMNVAVSRAKDNFLVFGDINCLKTDEKSASGLLRSMICENSVLKEL